MEHIAALEEHMISERVRTKLNEVNLEAQRHLSGIQDHVNFTLQKAYFKCAYECFERRRQEDINNCVEYCSVPAVSANHLVEDEMAQFQERLNRSLMVCQDRFEAAKLKKIKSSALSDMESCVDEAIQESMQLLPPLVNRLKTSLSIPLE